MAARTRKEGISMIMHVQAKDFQPCMVFCDGVDISNTCFFADDEAGVAYCYYPLSEITQDGRITERSSSVIKAFPIDMFAPHVHIPDDAIIIRRMEGKIEIIEDLPRRRYVQKMAATSS